jgi:hypothetical protein
MVYFVNFDNKSLNKYEKNLKNRKNLIDTFFYLDWWWFKFHAISLLFYTPSKIIKILYNLQWFKFNGLWWSTKQEWSTYTSLSFPPTLFLKHVLSHTSLVRFIPFHHSRSTILHFQNPILFLDKFHLIIVSIFLNRKLKKSWKLSKRAFISMLG